MYNTCNMDFECNLFLDKVRVFTKGKLRMVKAMTGKAMARITLLQGKVMVGIASEEPMEGDKSKKFLRVSSWLPSPVTR